MAEQAGPQRAASVDVDGRTVALTPDGIAKARAEGIEIGQALAEQLRRDISE